MRAPWPIRSGRGWLRLWPAPEMVLIRHRDADGVLSRPLGHIGFFLFFGADAGLANERLRKVVAGAIDDPSDAFQLVRLDGDELAADPGRLADELNTIGLFGGRRAIWIKAGSKNFLVSLEHLMSRVPPDAIVLVEAGNLKKDSALRKLFERERLAVAIECDHDSDDQIRALVRSEADAAGLQIEPETVALIARSLGNDRGSTRMELEKLLLYAHDTGKITDIDVEAALAEATLSSTDAAIQAAFSGNLAVTDDKVQQILAESDASVLLGYAMRYAVMLQRGKLDMGRGMSRDGAAEKTRLRAFLFPDKRVLANQIESWSHDQLTALIDLLQGAILAARTDARLDETVATRAFWNIAAMARRSARG